MALSAIKEHVIRTSVLDACTRHGIGHDSKLRHQLENEAEIPDGSRDAYVTAGGLSLDARIEELAKVPKFSGELPRAAPTVSAADQASLTANFADIASGKIKVIK
jgi:hypothetical protein